MPGAVFPEGPAFFRGTFHASARFPGRSCVFQGVPSMLGTVFMEGHGAGSGLVILLCGFLPRLGSKTAQIDPSLLFFF